MFRKCFSINLLYMSILGFSWSQLYAQEEKGEIIIISERVGKEIDKEERDQYELFREVNGFQSAVIVKLPENKYILKITFLNEQTVELKSLQSQQSEASINSIRYKIDHFENKQTQEKKNSAADYFLGPSTSFYIELLGKGFYSFNVDYRKNKSRAMSLGVQWAEDAFIASFMYYRFKGERFRTEIGGGFSGVLIRDDGFAGLGIHGVYGYRYQKKNGFLFRIGFTPFIGIPFKSSGRFMIVPLVGISAGYSL